MEWRHPHLGPVFPPQLARSRNPSQPCPEVCFHGDPVFFSLPMKSDYNNLSNANQTYNQLLLPTLQNERMNKQTTLALARR